MLSEEQFTFLKAFEEYGHDGAAASSAGIYLSEVLKWKMEDEFVTAYENSRAQFAGSLFKEAITRARDGYEEPLIYKGQIQYMRDQETGELLLDDNLMPIPATIVKKSERMLALALKAHIDEYQPPKREIVKAEIETEVKKEPETEEIEVDNTIRIEFVDPNG